MAICTMIYIGNKIYRGFLYLEHTYNNPVANTFVALLLDRKEGPLSFKGKHTISQAKFIHVYTCGLSLKLRGRGKVSWITTKGNFNGKLNVYISDICIHVCICVVPPILRGARLMIVMLWQLFEYYIM